MLDGMYFTFETIVHHRKQFNPETRFDVYYIISDNFIQLLSKFAKSTFFYLFTFSKICFVAFELVWTVHSEIWIPYKSWRRNLNLDKLYELKSKENCLKVELIYRK